MTIHWCSIQTDNHKQTFCMNANYYAHMFYWDSEKLSGSNEKKLWEKECRILRLGRTASLSKKTVSIQRIVHKSISFFTLSFDIACEVQTEDHALKPRIIFSAFLKFILSYTEHSGLELIRVCLWRFFRSVTFLIHLWEK